MKKIIIPILALLLVGFNLADSPLTKAERTRAIKEMNKSSQHLTKTVRGLSEAQLNFKMNPNSWSIAENTEHIALSESIIFEMLENLLKEPSNSTRRSEVNLSDDAVLGIITDRSNKIKTQKPFEPSGKYGTHEAALKAFKSKRKDNIKFIKKTQEDLRNRYAEFPFGTIDAYQLILFMSGHTERHTLQIEEIMAHADFPTK